MRRYHSSPIIVRIKDKEKLEYRDNGKRDVYQNLIGFWMTVGK